jgi:hypothetical protein
MGRYYTGDIEGKFMFGVQSSDDANFFGVEGESRSLDYYYRKKIFLKLKRVLRNVKVY